jgi:hypothetical protein
MIIYTYAMALFVTSLNDVQMVKELVWGPGGERFNSFHLPLHNYTWIRLVILTMRYMIMSISWDYMEEKFKFVLKSNLF